mmetsp:Transcript_4173/g.11940  ORF Transcript_4173/g.11940 Transcript_4173/m.11940 type:complete len:99 (-) Transcript_4173:26-322(-)
MRIDLSRRTPFRHDEMNDDVRMDRYNGCAGLRTNDNEKTSKQTNKQTNATKIRCVHLTCVFAVTHHGGEMTRMTKNERTNHPTLIHARLRRFSVLSKE